jgi:hypothetical protein
MRPEFRQSALLLEEGFRHAFFTRNGGVSGGPCRSLNFSYAVGDESTHVDQNLALAAQTLGVATNRVFFAAQLHGAGVVELAGTEAQLDVVFTEADALTSGRPDLACSVRTADCVPILIADPSTGRVAAIHAGWRGLVADVVGAAAIRLGGPAGRWVAAVGPHISQNAFEVSEDVASQLEACAPTEAVLRQEGMKPHVSLASIVRAQLERVGMKGERIDIVAGCTRDEPELFFSFRRDGKHSGRHLSAIVPRG